MFAVDLTQIEGDGDFSCPQCENSISPTDESEETYSILEPKVNSHGLDTVVIRCNKCGSFIHLTGFPLLEELSVKCKDVAIEKAYAPLKFSRLRLPLGLTLGKLR